MKVGVAVESALATKHSDRLRVLKEVNARPNLVVTGRSTVLGTTRLCISPARCGKWQAVAARLVQVLCHQRAQFARSMLCRTEAAADGSFNFKWKRGARALPSFFRCPSSKRCWSFVARSHGPMFSAFLGQFQRSCAHLTTPRRRAAWTSNGRLLPGPARPLKHSVACRLSEQ